MFELISWSFWYARYRYQNENHPYCFSFSVLYVEFESACCGVFSDLEGFVFFSGTVCCQLWPCYKPLWTFQMLSICPFSGAAEKVRGVRGIGDQAGFVLRKQKGALLGVGRGLICFGGPKARPWKDSKVTQTQAWVIAWSLLSHFVTKSCLVFFLQETHIDPWPRHFDWEVSRYTSHLHTAHLYKDIAPIYSKMLLQNLTRSSRVRGRWKPPHFRMGAWIRGGGGLDLQNWGALFGPNFPPDP